MSVRRGSAISERLQGLEPQTPSAPETPQNIPAQNQVGHAVDELLFGELFKNGSPISEPPPRTRHPWLRRPVSMVLHKRSRFAERPIPHMESRAKGGPVISRTGRNVHVLKRCLRGNLAIGHRVHGHAPVMHTFLLPVRACKRLSRCTMICSVTTCKLLAMFSCRCVISALGSRAAPSSSVNLRL